MLHCLCEVPLYCPDVHYGAHIAILLLSTPSYMPESNRITFVCHLFHLCFVLVKSVSYAFVSCIHHKLICITYAFIHLVKYSCTGFLCSLLTEIIHPNESMGTPERAQNTKINYTKCARKCVCTCMCVKQAQIKKEENLKKIACACWLAAWFYRGLLPLQQFLPEGPACQAYNSFRKKISKAKIRKKK